MDRLALCFTVACATACSPQSTTAGYSGAPTHSDRSVPEASNLNEVQRSCRVSENSFLGTASHVFGPTCAGGTMQVTLSTFDMATFKGFTLAEQHMFTLIGVCICRQFGCSPEQLEEHLQKIRGQEDAVERSLNDGAMYVMESLAGHECLDASVGVEIYKRGHTCGFFTGARSSLIRDKMADVYAGAFRDQDRIQVRKYAAECWDWSESLWQSAEDGE